MKTKHYIFIGIVAYSFFLLILTPAATVIPLLNIPAHQAKFEGIQGSIWNTSVDQIQLPQQLLEHVTWQIKPLSLLTASLNADVSTQLYQQTVNAQINRSLLSQLTEVNNLTSTVPASAIQDKLNLPFGELEGELKLNIDTAIYEPGKLPAITGLVSWKDAKIILSDSLDLGHIFLRIEPTESGDLKAKLSNLQGQVSLNGDINITANQRYTLNLTLQPRANAPAELLSILNLIAPRKNQNTHLLNRSGHLSELGIKL